MLKTKEEGSDAYHFTYRITNTRLNKHYYGVRTSKNGILPKDDIGTIYFSSSSDKWFMKDQRTNPEDYKYKVIRISETRDLAAQLEMYLQNKFNVGINPNFFNRCIATSTGYSTYGIPISQETKDKRRNTKQNKSLEEKAITSAKLSTAHKDRSPEKESERLAKKKATCDARTSKEKAITSAKLSTAHKDRSPEKESERLAKKKATCDGKTDEEKSMIKRKQGDYWRNLSPEEKVNKNNKYTKTWNNKSGEEREAIAIKQSIGWHKKPQAEKDHHTASRLATNNNKSIAEKKAFIDKMSEVTSGSRNPRALLIHIYDSEDILRFKCHGSFKKICRENNLPVAFLSKSYNDHNLSGFKKGCAGHKFFEKFKHCEGWYARRIEK